MTEMPSAGGAAATLATPSVSRMADTRAPVSVSSATTWSGPLNPGPNPSASMSYACRVVVDSWWLPWSVAPSRKESSGSARKAITTKASAAIERGRFWTYEDQRAASPLASAGSGPVAARRRRCLRLSTRGPSSPSSEGSSVMAARTLKITVREAAMTTPSRKRMFITSIPASAMHTVPPAKSTARPEVFRACTADSSDFMPRRMPRRCRVTMKSA